MEQKELNLNMPPDVKPIYADEANVVAGLKVNIEKNDKGKEVITKTGNINIIFFDNTTKAVVSRVVVDPITAKNLANQLKANAENIMTEIKSDKIPQQMKDQIEKTNKPVTRTVEGYIG